MVKEAPEAGRVIAFSDGVFAVIITVLVLELRPPEQANLAALHDLWPTAISYAVSYLFIAIVWMNHHHLLRYADVATPKLVWGNFAHLFTVSLLPFSTAWIADTRLSAVPVLRSRLHVGGHHLSAFVLGSDRPPPRQRPLSARPSPYAHARLSHHRDLFRRFACGAAPTRGRSRPDLPLPFA